jgi:putative ABC transport system ATP-binding protein
VLLRLEQVTKRYVRPAGEQVALNEVSLEVARGEMVGVFGPSGVGKTTLLRVAAGLTRPDSGSVSYNGERLDSMSSSELTRFRRREIACVWSSSATISDGLTVLEHVLLPLLIDHRDRRAAKRLAREALLACEVDQVGDLHLQELSYGERQRVAVAHALVTEPRLLLADSPVSQLSVVEQEQMMALLASLAREANVALLLTDSNAEVLGRCDRVLYLNEGKLLGSEPEPGHGRVYQFPPSAARSAADA